MKSLEKYLNFCVKFNKRKLPQLKFKRLNERYLYLYKNIYNIQEEDVNKASFFVFLFSFSSLILLSIAFIAFNILIITLYSIILSFLISYRFNLILYYDIKKKESIINTMLPIIKIDFSLIQNTLEDKSDYCIYFIKLLKKYKLPILGNFKKILNKIQAGAKPEDVLLNLITPSNDFNQYIKNLLIKNFNTIYKLEDNENSALEKKFKIYLREIQSKISIFFFIGVFFPIGLCFLILFQIINLILLLFLIPFFLYFLNILFKKFIKKNSFMIGILSGQSKIEKKKFNEFFMFLNNFAINLKNNISPEKAFLKSYTQNKTLFVLLNEPLKNQISQLLNFICSFKEMVQYLKLELKSLRYNIILDAIEKFVKENAYYSSEKIIDILNIIQKHQNLEKDLSIIIKGEKFKIFFFLFFLPILIGAISGMFPFFILITRNIYSNNPIIFEDLTNLINLSHIIVIFIIFISSISITSNYFLKIINCQNKFQIILICNFIFLLSFILSFLNTTIFI
ncbi:MAG: hypothetical protein ACFFBF_14610 [Promethearchaeota archaeon]